MAENIEDIVCKAVKKAYSPYADRDAFTVDDFCARHHIGRTVFYEILKDGTGPKTFKVGAKTLISREAAAAWRAEREAASNCARKVANVS